ncbi:pyridine nucleotide-disulfide oxidoreductase [Pseudoxanthomonas kalamensis DSM 18571]|uniref:NAD(P)/FAD-dependent oxidoreductase n=1 Tax=Pseudoxanthomonas kalamensis TaxID=289483 RepID=UPI001391CA0F|nr:FAD-dependent oxidoreductase [Pseudoxanthomonas kalamensis]KAF1711371.1 pyridine nucleotide-disulfide oxidoreductase [Pseudoxanthomonas kalamensis DSM 18571]
MSRISILGSGFAALTAIRELRKQGVDAEITVVSPRAELVYLPSLIWLPSGRKRGEDLRIPLQDFFSRQRVRWHQGSVQQVLNGGRRVLTDRGEVENDYLVIATGGRYLRKLPGIEHAIIPCEGIAAAESIRDRLAALEGGTIAVGFATNPKEPGAVRGGPMFEFLFGIDTLLRQQGRRDKFRLVFFNPSPQPGQRLGPSAVSNLLAQMARQDIDTHLGHKMVRLESGKVVTEGGEFDADLILFMPGLTGPTWLEGSELPRSEGGFVAADANCRAQGMPRVYVAGDAGSYPGPDWMAKQAHQADLQAAAVARNIAAELRGQPARHGFKTELVCIVDSLDSGMLVFRNDKRNLVLPRLRLFHWLKRKFEDRYLKAYR